MKLELFKKKYGREKTNKIARRHCCSFVAFLIIAFFGFFEDDLITSTTTLLAVVFLEAVYGCYMLLSLRLRKLEEPVEEAEYRKKGKEK